MTPLTLQGTAYARGFNQFRIAQAAQVRAATVGRVETARAEGLFDEAALAYLEAQRAFHTRHDPEGMAELRGIAAGFDLQEPDLFCHLHLGTLRDLKGGAAMVDGCSAWAVCDGADGPLVVKNRDFSGLHLGIQTIARHQGADVTTGAMLCLGSLGSPGAYSSGINARGFALADTQVSVASHRVGWLRYFLMTRLLARCANVTEALAMIADAPHAGGGTLVMADAGGSIAAVELGAAPVTVAQGPDAVWRTNHFSTPELAADTLRPRDDSIADTSRARFDYLATALPRQGWDRPSAARLMATHAKDAPGSAPICQHGDRESAQTISSVVYSCKLTQADLIEGNPCSGTWQTVHLTT
jgi:isopenicillin-N N-acyltransferase like protein